MSKNNINQDYLEIILIFTDKFLRFEHAFYKVNKIIKTQVAIQLLIFLFLSTNLYLVLLFIIKSLFIKIMFRF